MIKYLFVTINSLILFLYSLFLDGGAVTVSGNFPANMKPGTEVVVDLVVKKGGMGGFAKLQVEVPAGFTVAEVESKGGTFSFASGMAKWIWTGVPSDPEFTVKFKLQVDASTNGAKTIAAKYSYIENNNKQVSEMPPVEIMVGDGSAVAATSPTTTETKPAETPTIAAVTPTETPTVAATPTPTEPANTNTVSSNAEPNSIVSGVRTVTKGTNENDWNINIVIKKPGIKGFARYSDNLPEGYSAKQGKTNGSSFSVADNKIKFVWVNVPTNDEVDISYTMSGSSNTDTYLNGEFSYLENNQSKAYKLPQEKFGAPMAGNIKHTPTETVAVTPTETKPVETPTVAAVNETKPVETPTVAAVTETKPLETPTVAAVNETKPVENTTASTQTALENNTARKDGNVSYCVQIGAYTNSAVTASMLTGKYGFSETVRSEMAEGFNKFLIGKHEEYKPARDHRETARGKGVRGAFVAAYNGPKRITVQEALMLSNQKWYK